MFPTGNELNYYPVLLLSGDGVCPSGFEFAWWCRFKAA